MPLLWYNITSFFVYVYGYERNRNFQRSIKNNKSIIENIDYRFWSGIHQFLSQPFQTASDAQRVSWVVGGHHQPARLFKSHNLPSSKPGRPFAFATARAKPGTPGLFICLENVKNSTQVKRLIIPPIIPFLYYFLPSFSFCSNRVETSSCAILQHRQKEFRQARLHAR